jgi:cellulose synthase/poly-beta-1,6-N-acetylglucosamine synthase-like glycosyltransferase
MTNDNFLHQLQLATSEEARTWLITQRLLASLPAELAKMAWAAAIPHWFNADILAALHPELAPQAKDLYTQLQSLPFVEPFERHGHNIHELVRQLILAHLWKDHHEEFVAISQRAADYFSKIIHQSADPQTHIERIYHLLIADPEAGADALRDQGWRWHNAPLSAYALVRALAQAVREHANAGRINGRGRGWGRFWEGLTADDYHQNAEAISAFLDVIAGNYEDSNLNAAARFRLGNVHMRLSELPATRQTVYRLDWLRQALKRFPITPDQAIFLAALLLPLIFILLLILSGGLPDLLDLLAHRLFATTGLLFGLFFFLYAVKYYVSTALILTAGNWNRNNNGNDHGGGGGNDHGNSYYHKPELERQPFISVHLPMYNEVNVIDRLLKLCTAFDYDNYEVIVLDDSNDPAALASLEDWKDKPHVRIHHRPNRTGFKGGALQEGLKIMDERTEFVLVFDADFAPPPQILNQFLAYFYKDNGETSQLRDEQVAAVQGYQWHLLNAGENWITRGVRTEFSGSYVIERSSQELLSGMKMIAGAVFMIRADILRQIGWGTSITEDWELTLKLYLNNYKVLYTPYIEALAECVSDFRRLTRQRMRWAEGHTFNIKRYLGQVLRSPHMTWMEKLECVYYAPYYLQSCFFILGTAAWLISEIILHAKIPYWTAVAGWTLVFSNTLALFLMNLGGLFLEKDTLKNLTGLFSFLILSTLLAPYQAYASLKGLLERDEGGWDRTLKSGNITESFGWMTWRKKIKRLLPKGQPAPRPSGAPIFPSLPLKKSPRWRLGWLVTSALSLTTLWITLSAVAVSLPTVVLARGGQSITLVPSNALGNSTFTIKGTGWCPDSASGQVQIKWASTSSDLANAAPDALGNFTTASVPNSTDPGTHTVTASQTCSNGDIIMATATSTVLPEIALVLMPGALLLVRQLKRRRKSRSVRSRAAAPAALTSPKESA